MQVTFWSPRPKRDKRNDNWCSTERSFNGPSSTGLPPPAIPVLCPRVHREFPGTCANIVFYQPDHDLVKVRYSGANIAPTIVFARRQLVRSIMVLIFFFAILAPPSIRDAKMRCAILNPCNACSFAKEFGQRMGATENKRFIFMIRG